MFAKEESDRVIKKLKKGKTPGPDGIPTGYLKALDGGNKEELLKYLNAWYKNEELPKELSLAQVVFLKVFKKGDLANCRPTSLLTIYKIFASLIHNHIADEIDDYLMETKYGFRKDKSITDAIHIIRRVSHRGFSIQGNFHMVLLDWEKAFDKIFIVNS